jgi:hypothetical protein
VFRRDHQIVDEDALELALVTNLELILASTDESGGDQALTQNHEDKTAFQWLERFLDTVRQGYKVDPWLDNIEHNFSSEPSRRTRLLKKQGEEGSSKGRTGELRNSVRLAPVGGPVATRIIRPHTRVLRLHNRQDVRVERHLGSG